jgi:hypothetical protein
MKIKFQKLEEPNLSNNRPENPLHTIDYYRKTKSVHDQLMNCICWHSICGHRFIFDDSSNNKRKAGKCDYPNCICEEFKQGEVDIWDEIREIEENKRKYEGGLF